MKKNKREILENKYEIALVRANRFDIFGIIERLNKKRKRKQQKLAEELGFEIIEPDDFDITEWSPRIPRKKRSVKN